jgi:hypothetical protein
MQCALLEGCKCTSVSMNAIVLICLTLVFAFDLRRFRGLTSDRKLRHFCVDILRSIALNLRGTTEDLKHPFLVRVAAVVEIERCLSAVFETRQHAHESAPALIDALESVFKSYISSCSTVEQVNSTFIQKTVLAVTAFGPLTRLRVAIDNHVAYRPRLSQSAATFDVLLSFFVSAKKYRSAIVETLGAPFVLAGDFLESSEMCNGSAISTSVSIIGLLQSAFEYLQISDTLSADPTSAFSFIRQCIRIHSFDVLRHAFLACIPFKVQENVATKIFSEGRTVGMQDNDEVLSRSLALIQCAENAFLETNNDGSMQHEPQYLSFMLSLVLGIFESKVNIEKEKGCHAVSLLISTLIKTEKDPDKLSMLTLLYATLRRQLLAIGLDDALHSLDFKQNCVSLLTVFYDLILPCRTRHFPEDIAMPLFRLATFVSAQCNWSPDSYLVQLSLRCLVGLIQHFDLTEFKEALSVFEDLTRGSRNQVVEAIGQLTLVSHRVLGSARNLRRSTFAASTHETILIEGEKIQRFEFNEYLPDSRAAWLFDQTILLTCRLGKGRYQGFVEIVVRAHWDRRVVLARIPGCVSLDDPNGVVPRELTKCKAMELNTNTESVGQTYQPSKQINDILDRFNASIPLNPDHVIIEKAARHRSDVVARFDAMMAPAEDSAQARVDDEIKVSSEEAFEESVSTWLHSILGKADQCQALKKEIDSLLIAFGIHNDEMLPSGEGSVLVQRLEFTDKLDRAIAILDRAPIMNTHKVALLYDQSAVQKNSLATAETHLLATKLCSPSFYKFAKGLGEVVPLQSLKLFAGGLDTSEYNSDGVFALAWNDCDYHVSLPSSSAVIFHVVSFMPDGKRQNIDRKRHVGNDYVLILFADRGSDAIVDYDLHGGDLIGGQFGVRTNSSCKIQHKSVLDRTNTFL